MNPTDERNDDNGSVHKPESAGSDTEGQKETNTAAGGETQAAGSGQAPNAGDQSQGRSQEGSAAGEGSGQETDQERRARLKRDKDRERAREKRAQAKIGLVPAEVAPNTPKSKAAKADGKAKASNLTADFFAKQIYGTHELLGLFFGEEAKIDREGAVMLGEAVYEVVKEYDLEYIGKFGKWSGLITAAAIVEVPVIMRLQKKASLAKAKPLTQTVSQLPNESAPLGIATGAPN